MRDPELEDKLRGLMIKGADAQALLQKLDPAFVELRERYRSNLVHSVRTKADQQTLLTDACRIAALEDLYQEFFNHAQSGARAQKMATQIERSEAK